MSEFRTLQGTGLLVALLVGAARASAQGSTLTGA